MKTKRQQYVVTDGTHWYKAEGQQQRQVAWGGQQNKETTLVIVRDTYIRALKIASGLTIEPSLK
jgi:hypothetical protein